ncbi:hypothetical protein PYW08_011127 [Mythimna loreyi]|uniref:Uncharacterized protein n=2 Tax=Mythimna loreyi TaxID=667449 RepID=A0ACC2Q7H5_9NEOP|nr:hypothetical protein PYW08_011125 [Mythimna loreyi]KAJ8706993.1 hypothetical protein PYW08_011127 [Mythimna loreyi]
MLRVILEYIVAIDTSEKTCSYLLLENMAKKCFLCDSDDEIIDFNDETFKNCILKLAFRKKKNFKYNFVELSSASLQFVGYHTTCYKKVTVLNKKYNEEFLQFSAEYAVSI